MCNCRGTEIPRDKHNQVYFIFSLLYRTPEGIKVSFLSETRKLGESKGKDLIFPEGKRSRTAKTVTFSL